MNTSRYVVPAVIFGVFGIMINGTPTGAFIGVSVGILAEIWIGDD